MQTAAKTMRRNPTDFERRILVTVAGLTPQIITETVYALARVDDPPFVPTRIVVLTTVEGAERARLTLLGETPGWFERLRRDYSLPPITFTAEDIRILRDGTGEPMRDIRTDSDNSAAADGIVDAIRELTADPDCAVHVSMAGGRKTLGFYAAYALSLFGRPQDRLSHVLVSEAFENNPDFFYPTPYRHVIYDRDKKPLNAAEAQVSLAEIPLVLLRNGVPAPLLSGGARMSEVVNAVQQRLETPRLVVDLRRLGLTFGDVAIPLQKQLLAFYVWMLRAQGEPRPAWKRAIPGALAEISTEYDRMPKRDVFDDEVRVITGDARLAELKGRTNRAIERALRATRVGMWLDLLLVQSGGRRNATTYSIGLDPGLVTIIESEYA
jgi:CRISPR-associated protein (TIGR02584 family)